MDKNCQEEIQYRQFLMNELNKGNCNKEYVQWLNTHSFYHYKLEAPFYLNVVETLEKNQWYSLRIVVESLNYEDAISPVIKVAFGEGQIITDFEVRNFEGKASVGKPIKMLSFEPEKPEEYNVTFQGELGLLSVQYECSYFDAKRRLYRTELSGTTGGPEFAIRREPINDHSVRYFCKSPVNDSFDAMVFTVEWKKRDPDLNK